MLNQITYYHPLVFGTNKTMQLKNGRIVNYLNP